MPFQKLKYYLNYIQYDKITKTMAKNLELQIVSSFEEFKRLKREAIKDITVDIKQDTNLVAIRLQKTKTMPNLLMFSEDILRIYMAHKVQCKMNEVCKVQIGFFRIVDKKKK